LAAALPLRREIENDDEARRRRRVVRFDDEETLAVGGDVETGIRGARAARAQREQPAGHAHSKAGSRLNIHLEHLSVPGEEEPAAVATPPWIAPERRDLPACVASLERSDEQRGCERRRIHGHVADEPAVR